MHKISFMTLGCPEWDIDTICARGQEYGFDGIDFRGYLGTIDLSTLPEFTTSAAGTIQKIKDAGLEVSGVSTNNVISSVHRLLPNGQRCHAFRTLE